MFTPAEMCDVWYGLATALSGAKKNLEKEPHNMMHESNVQRLEVVTKIAHELMVRGRDAEWVEWSFDNKMSIRKLPYQVSFSEVQLKHAKEHS
jgi:hypothetical protein